MTVMLSCISLVGNGWSMIAFPVLEGWAFDFKEAVLVASLVGVFQVLGRLGEMASAQKHTALRTAQVSKHALRHQLRHPRLFQGRACRRHHLCRSLWYRERAQHHREGAR